MTPTALESAAVHAQRRSVSNTSNLVSKMLVVVRAELVTALASDQAWEAPGQARVWGWAERPARERLVRVLVT